jgi:hypothetical protein
MQTQSGSSYRTPVGHDRPPRPLAGKIIDEPGRFPIAE